MATLTAKENKTAEKSIPQEIRNLAAAIKADLKIDPNTGVATVPKNMYDRLLPENVTREMVEQVASANADIAAAAVLAVGEASIPLMKKHGELTNVTLELPATSRDVFQVVFDRKSKVADVGRSEDGKMVHNGFVERFGQVRVGFKTFGTRNKGQMAQIKDHLNAEATKALSGG